VDDQAETVLMKFLRGAGTKGLAGIYPEVKRGDAATRFIRPLLSATRADVEVYLASTGQPWREDESNLDQHFRRNRVRHELLPLLEKEYSPNLRQSLNDAAEIARGEEAYWEAALDPLLGLWHDPPRRLRLMGFASMQLALQRRLLKRFLELEGMAFTFRHIERVRQCALGKSPSCKLPGGWMACAEGEHLVLHESATAGESDAGYEVGLTIATEVLVREMLIRAVPVAAQFAAEEAPGTLLRADALQGVGLTLRNWRPGDRYHPAYSGSEEKLKRLFSEQRIPAEERPSWPLVVSGTEIVWVRGLPVAESYCWRPGDGDAVKIECVPESNSGSGDG
jgi:tRNA(Ile)-lysidine synthase